MQRVQTESRKHFDYYGRVQVLNKTGCKCARCGMSLDTKSMTVDHFIPLSKGGSNDYSNLIPLCHDCNVIKNNYVMHPCDYINYLDDEHKDEILRIYDWYCEDYKWYNKNNLTIEDKAIIYYPLMLQSSKAHRKKGDWAKLYTGNAIIEKVDYSMMDELYEYITKYMKKYDLDTSELKDIMSEIFGLGCLYRVRNNSGIIAVIPMKVEKIFFEDTEFYIYTIPGIPMLYQKENYKYLIKDTLRYILGNLSRLNPDHLVTYRITYPVRDEFLNDTLWEFTNCFGENDEWRTSFGYKYFETPSEMSVSLDSVYKTIETNRSSSDFKEMAQTVSPVLERLFALRPVDKVENDFDITKQRTPKEKGANRQYRKKQRMNSVVKQSNNKYKRAKQQLVFDDYDKEIRNYV